jgi:predicted TIM-barrel fold metal-dependent hydrolase
MAYIQERAVYDADSHLMETPDFLTSHADPHARSRMPELRLSTVKPGEERRIEEMRSLHADAAYRARDADEIMLRKNWSATGSFIKEDLSRALDLLGVRGQLVFNTFTSAAFVRAEQSGDASLAYDMALAHNRAMAEFCSADARLYATGYVPLADVSRAPATARHAIELGCKALLIPSKCPRGHSPSHVALEPLWEVAEDAGVPMVFHVGGGGELLERDYFENGRPLGKDFHGGEENFRSIDYMAIPRPVMQTLSVLILDGVLERFSRLKFGVIEQGASWMPGWMRQLDSALEAFGRHEDRFKSLSRAPSEYVRRQVRATPYPTEDVGWIIEQGGEEICLFSTDYPHVEGGRNPFARFEATTARLSERARQRFYYDNFVDLMGRALGAS